ncbi:hypothetical protein SCNRRL3882_7780 [Streptomyces chartreusis NRRL 3882]|uniref:Uncharacterized protein n=1 Tax=Streptomyces chartreusis NRRL 3882 TaxID=1079985 RepID=A0A2N9BLW1_STRCX|nr:hypothetical protein SCNRRL3882_7780 [Streptomyces chartreusis NRRL 3882]
MGSPLATYGTFVPVHLSEPARPSPWTKWDWDGVG